MRPGCAFLLTILLAGCDRPQPIGGASATSPARVTTAKPITRDPAGTVVEIDARYHATTDGGRRRAALYDLHDLPGADALPVLGRWLSAEGDPSLRVELLDSLDVYPGEVETKLAILGTVLSQPTGHGDVRDAALDALLAIHDPRAVVLWRRLLADPSEEVRDLARATIGEFESAPSP